MTHSFWFRFHSYRYYRAGERRRMHLRRIQMEIAQYPDNQPRLKRDTLKKKMTKAFSKSTSDNTWVFHTLILQKRWLWLNLFGISYEHVVLPMQMINLGPKSNLIENRALVLDQVLPKLHTNVKQFFFWIDYPNSVQNKFLNTMWAKFEIHFLFKILGMNISKSFFILVCVIYRGVSKTY